MFSHRTDGFVCVFLCAPPTPTPLPPQDVGYHFVAVVLYLSASVILAYITLLKGWGMTIAPGNLIVNVLTSDLLKIYRLDIAAVV